MGCQVVSVYNDEVAGAIGYPEQLLDDLHRRDYSTANLIKQVPPKHNLFVYGFTQSYAEGNMFSYVLGGKEYLIFSSGRFLVVTCCSDWSQRAIMHEDRVMGLDASGKLCVTGTLGGRVILWDLQFFQQKVNIQMPEGSINFSSLSLSGKYIFCTDTIQPSNNVYCYDLRTTKLRAQGTLGSFEPTLKGVSWGSNFHVTVAADGVWFSRFVEADGSKLDITKGMFRIFPKTSMTCVAVVDETYVISGSIDGYVFLWAHLQCQKAIRVADSCISAMALHKKFLVVSNFKDNVRVFSYKISKKKEMEEDERANGEITNDFVAIVMDSYERSHLQAILISKLDESIYFAQTRSGTLCTKMIPAPEFSSKANFYRQTNQNLIEFNRDAQKSLHGNTMWSLSLNRPFFQITETSLAGEPTSWRAANKYLSNAKNYCLSEKPRFLFIPQLRVVCFVGETSISTVEVARMGPDEDIKISSLREETVLKFNNQSAQVLGLAHFFLSFHYLIIFFQRNFVMMRFEEGKWAQTIAEDYEGQVIKHLEVEGQTIKFEDTGSTFRARAADWDEEKMLKLEFMHCTTDLEAVESIEGRTVSVAGDSLIVSK